MVFGTDLVYHGEGFICCFYRTHMLHIEQKNHQRSLIFQFIFGRFLCAEMMAKVVLLRVRNKNCFSRQQEKWYVRFDLSLLANSPHSGLWFMFYFSLEISLIVPTTFVNINMNKWWVWVIRVIQCKQLICIWAL